MDTVEKRAVLITGCDSGVGFSLASHLNDTHPDLLTLACCYESSSEGALQLSKKSNVKVLQVDVTKRESIENLKKQVDTILREENCQLWTLVNNAASLVFADAIWQTE